MSLVTSAIKYPVTVAVGVLIAFLGGFLALMAVPVQLTPDVDRPVINVGTSWIGASPEEIEREIIEEQEEYLKSVEGVVEMKSQSNDGFGSISLEFAVGTDVTGATVRVTNKLNEVPSYPENADRPVVSSSNRFDRAIAWFVVKGDSNVSVPHTLTYIEDVVKPRLERVQGVSSVNIFGGVEQELHVTFDPELLAATGITIGQLTNALRSQNRDISGGDFGEGKRRYIVRTMSRFETPEDVEKTVITTRGGIPIRIGDVAEAVVAYQKPVVQVRHKGRESLAFNVQRQLGANVLTITDALLEEVARLNKEVLASQGLRIENVYRETVYIESAVDRVFQNLYLGGLLAIAVLFLFLRSPTSVLVIGLSIPISIITTFLTMYAFGRTINVISLAGMAFAVGMVVDNAIVVLENIYRHLQMGKSKREAANDGTREVWGAVLASTLTTIAVFLPILFIQERAGQIFRDIAIAISSAIAVSLIVSVTVIPSASAKILKISQKLQGEKGRGTRLARFASRVSSIVDYINANNLRRLATIVGVVVITLGLSFLLLPSAEYLPNGNQNFIFGIMLPPPGYNLDEMVRVGQSVEARLGYLWETPAEEASDLPGGGVDNFFFVALTNQAFMGFSAREPTRARELLSVANQALFSVPGTFGFATQASLFSRGFAGTRSVSIDVTGPELETVLGIAAQVFQKVGQVLPGSQSRPIPGLDLGNPEVRVYPDRVRAADVGLDATAIGSIVNTLVDGVKVSEYFHEGREIDMVLRGRPEWAQHTHDIEHLPLATPSGQIITLGDIATIEQTQGPVQINHVERQRAVTIETVLPDGIALEDAIALIESEIVEPLKEQGQLGGLYNIYQTGTADDMSRLREVLKTNFFVVILLTYLLLAALFQSFMYPLVIMLTVPLATFGGVMGLRVVQLFDSSQQLDILTMLGFVILVGTVINNSILIVYHALTLMREQGMDSRAAVKESVRVRVRPIFMSTMTSTLGMLPLVVLPGAGSELYRGLGSVVLGGLVFSTVFTLFLTPLVFSYAIELQARVRKLLGLSPVRSSREPVMNGKA
ncbi:MAG: efflux RND transporter permease subunit [bacterium]|nr:efflux RND transporter permease subunit [bacterium]